MNLAIYKINFEMFWATGTGLIVQLYVQLFIQFETRSLEQHFNITNMAS